MLQIRAAAPLRSESWKLRIDSLTGPKSFRFSVAGEITGPDGSGSTEAGFRSGSGRVVIQPEDWYWAALFSDLSPGMEFAWSTFTTGTDTITGREDSGSPEWVDIVSNLEPGDHELIIEQIPGSRAISEIILYNPVGLDIGTAGVLYRLQGSRGFVALGWGSVEETDDLKN